MRSTSSKASIGEPFTAGRTGFTNAQCRFGSSSGFSPAGAVAPSSIHFAIDAICSFVSGFPSGGIRAPSFAEIRATSSLSFGFPFATTSAFSIAAAVSSRSSDSCLSAPWHAKQRSFRIGFTSRA